MNRVSERRRARVIERALRTAESLVSSGRAKKTPTYHEGAHLVDITLSFSYLPHHFMAVYLHRFSAKREQGASKRERELKLGADGKEEKKELETREGE